MGLSVLDNYQPLKGFLSLNPQIRNFLQSAELLSFKSKPTAKGLAHEVFKLIDNEYHLFIDELDFMLTYNNINLSYILFRTHAMKVRT